PTDELDAVSADFARERMEPRRLRPVTTDDERRAGMTRAELRERANHDVHAVVSLQVPDREPTRLQRHPFAERKRARVHDVADDPCAVAMAPEDLLQVRRRHDDFVRE